YPEPDEVYFLTGDDFNEQGKRDTYKNGEPFSTAKRGNPDVKVYEDHRPEGPGGTVAADGQNVQEQAAEPSGVGLLEAFKTVENWAGDGGMKKMMIELFKKPQFAEGGDEIQDQIRSMLYVDARRLGADPATDISAFSLLISAEDKDPETIVYAMAALKK